MSRHTYKCPKSRGFLPTWVLAHAAGWLSLRLGYELSSDAFTAVRSVPGGSILVEAMLPGPRGPRGETGDLGYPGPSVSPKGRKGPPGYAGPDGPPGTITGPVGDDGEPGFDGVMGLVGAKGAKGVKGDLGDAGDPGDPGPSKGPPGNPGLPGDDATGPPGPDGVPVPGPPGPNAPADGPTGPRGEQGDTGDPGDPGDPGTPGDKFAIVPVLSQCLGFFANEAPDVIFGQVVHVTMVPGQTTQTVDLDENFIGSVEPDTLAVVGATCSCLDDSFKTQLSGTTVVVVRDESVLQFSAHVTIHAIRRGMRRRRWDLFTDAARRANQEFYMHPLR